MSKDKEAAPRSIRGRQLACPICKHTQFFTQEYLLNTRVATFFNFDWTDCTAQTFICEQCGNILWFVPQDGG